MCGRYSLVTKAEQIHRQISADISVPQELPTNYNVAPTQVGAVITNQQPDQVSLFRWGLVPFWAKDLSIGARMINARAEGIEDKPSFRKPIRERRCLVLADSFYEWKKDGKQKTPYRIYDPERPLLVMAGLWEQWGSGDDTVYSYSIITTAPNAEMKGIHDRMPVIFTDPKQWGHWLHEQPLADTLALLHHPPDGSLEMYPVPALVGNVRNNGPELHKKINT